MPELPDRYDPTNLMGNIVAVISDRSGLDEADVAERISAEWGDGDYAAAEDAIWADVGPLIDTIQERAAIPWEEGT